MLGPLVTLLDIRVDALTFHTKSGEKIAHIKDGLASNKLGPIVQSKVKVKAGQLVFSEG